METVLESPGRSGRPASRFLLVVVASAALAGAWTLLTTLTRERPAPPPAGLPAVDWPGDDGFSRKKIELGRLLFFDKRLSSDGTVACATCHDPAKGFADGRRVAEGIRGLKGDRNTPTVLNAAYAPFLFWDGRARSLEEQAKGSIGNRKEMTTEPEPRLAHEACVSRLRSVPGYRRLFREAYGTKAFTIDHVAGAIAAFERTLLSGDSPYDRFLAGDRAALTPAQARGMDLFFNKAMCSGCHSGPHLTDQGFAVSGVGGKPGQKDPGRFTLTGYDNDLGAFKTPSLRNVALTAPYMHDGSLATLEEVIEQYDRGIDVDDPRIDDRLIAPRNLTPPEEEDLVAFLHALTGRIRRDFHPPSPAELPR